MIDRIPLGVLIAAAILFGLAPFVTVPHLWEKLVMLFNGELTRPVDVFDLFVHGGPLLLLAWKLKRRYRPGGSETPEDFLDS